MKNFQVISGFENYLISLICTFFIMILFFQVKISIILELTSHHFVPYSFKQSFLRYKSFIIYSYKGFYLYLNRYKSFESDTKL